MKQKNIIPFIFNSIFLLFSISIYAQKKVLMIGKLQDSTNRALLKNGEGKWIGIKDRDTLTFNTIYYDTIRIETDSIIVLQCDQLKGRYSFSLDRETLNNNNFNGVITFRKSHDGRSLLGILYDSSGYYEIAKYAFVIDITDLRKASLKFLGLSENITMSKVNEYGKGLNCGAQPKPFPLELRQIQEWKLLRLEK